MKMHEAGIGHYESGNSIKDTWDMKMPEPESWQQVESFRWVTMRLVQQRTCCTKMISCVEFCNQRGSEINRVIIWAAEISSRRYKGVSLVFNDN